jgi:hypothetical protein
MLGLWIIIWEFFYYAGCVVGGGLGLYSVFKNNNNDIYYAQSMIFGLLLTIIVVANLAVGYIVNRDKSQHRENYGCCASNSTGQEYYCCNVRAISCGSISDSIFVPFRMARYKNYDNENFNECGFLKAWTITIYVLCGYVSFIMHTQCVNINTIQKFYLCCCGVNMFVSFCIILCMVVHSLCT